MVFEKCDEVFEGANVRQPIPVFVIGIWNAEAVHRCCVLSSVQKSGLKHQQILKAAGLDVVAGPDMIWKREPVSQGQEQVN